ncbi:MAG: hypothetical protein HZB42_14155 [Sphingobacteriales bacterium]|nr:hypothetical protein [Sphingobacteriales bacterium]
MKSMFLIVGLTALVSCMSCKKENNTSNGVSTVIKGHVEDPIRGINISGYKIVLIKKVGMDCAGWLCGTVFEKIAETYTDNNGDYLIKFNYKVEAGQDYYLEEQYYGTPYYHESSSGSGPIVGGATNIINMTAWKPVELKLNVQVMNNNIPPLNIRNELAATHQTLLNVESIYQQNINGTYILRSRPNSDISIIFYYTVNYASPNPVTHQKIIPYRTTLDSTVTLNFMIDCSTF